MIHVIEDDVTPEMTHVIGDDEILEMIVMIQEIDIEKRRRGAIVMPMTGRSMSQVTNIGHLEKEKDGYV